MKKILIIKNEIEAKIIDNKNVSAILLSTISGTGQDYCIKIFVKDVGQTLETLGLAEYENQAPIVIEQRLIEPH